jgi:hypothetical protein
LIQIFGKTAGFHRFSPVFYRLLAASDGARVSLAPAADNDGMNISPGSRTTPANTSTRIASETARETARKTTAWPGWVLANAALVFMTQAIAADPAGAQTAAAHPISGKWTWTLPAKACTETVQYRADGKRLGTSGEEVTEAEFRITPLPSLLGFYRLDETLTVANGKPDCAGDLHVAGDTGSTRFIQFSPKKDQLIVCKTESLQACYGPLRRVPG